MTSDLPKSNQRRSFVLIDKGDPRFLWPLLGYETLGDIPELYKSATPIHVREVSPELDLAISGLVEALELWVKYEEEQIAKDGPYVSLKIPQFIAKAKAAITSYKVAE